jgi:hypothetical protein
MLLLSITAQAQALNTSASDSESEGLVGSIDSVRYETAVLTFDDRGIQETGRWVDNVVTYSRRGKLLTVTLYGDNKIQRKRIYAYDGNTILLKEAEFDYGKVLHSVTKYVHLAQQRAVVRLLYTPRGELLPNRIISIYDDGGRALKLIQDDGINEPLIWILLKYGTADKPIEFIHCTTNNRDTSNSVDESNNCEGGRYVGKVVTKYTESGNPERETQYNGDGSMFSDVRYEYECDDKGSWVKRYKYNLDAVDGEMNPRPSEVTYRTIRYRPTQPNKRLERTRNHLLPYPPTSGRAG